MHWGRCHCQVPAEVTASPLTCSAITLYHPTHLGATTTSTMLMLVWYLSGLLLGSCRSSYAPSQIPLFCQNPEGGSNHTTSAPAGKAPILLGSGVHSWPPKADGVRPDLQRL